MRVIVLWSSAHVLVEHCVTAVLVECIFGRLI